MIDILIGQSYFLRFDPKLWDAMQPYAPLGSIYAASYLRQKGYRVALFDAMLAESEEQWAQAIDRFNPRYTVLFEDNFNYLSKMCLLRMRSAAFEMIKMARRRGCTVIAGGADASDHPARYLDQGADFVLVGEGEITLGELLDSISGRRTTPLQDIAGLVYKSSKRTNSTLGGEITITTRRPDIRDLDRLPFPAWDLVDVPRYRQIWLERHGYFSMNVATTRGCPFHCNWCAKPIWGQRYNVRSPENVVAELEWLKQAYSPEHIWFVDDIFGLKPGWLPHFADLVESKQARIPFKSLNRVDLLLRRGDIEALKKAGAHTVWVGAESGSQKILDAMDKGTRVAQIFAATRRLQSAGIRVGFFLQFGYPGETFGDIQQTLQLVRDCQPDDIGMSVSYPLPGTKFYRAVKEQLGIKRNWDDSNDLAMLYHGPFTTEFYRQLHVTLHKEFRLRRYWSDLRPGFMRRETPGKLAASRNKSSLRPLARFARDLVTLPLERRQLERLAKVHQPDLPVSPQQMTPEAAAQPSSQPD